MQSFHTPDELTDDERDCAAEVLEVVPLVMRTIRAEMRSRSAEGLSVPQFRALGYLRRNRGASLSDIADYLGLTLPSTSRIVDGLVVRGLVGREPAADDRRRITLTLSEDGQRLLASAREGTQESLGARLAALSPEERESVTGAMELLRRVFAEGKRQA